MIRRCCCMLLATSTVILGGTLALRGDGPKDNLPDSVRRIPQVGIDVPPAVRAELEAGLKELGATLARLEKREPRVAALLPDIRIFEKAVHDALTYQEFFAPKDLDKARALLAEGKLRAVDLE